MSDQPTSRPPPVAAIGDTPPGPSNAADTVAEMGAAAAAATTAIMNAPPASEPVWAKPAVAIFSLGLLLGVIVYAIVMKDHDTMMLIVGAVISMATTAGSYYLGNSAGSDHKTNLLAASPPVQGTKNP